MKKIILLLAFCLSVGNLFAQDANADKLREEGDAAMTAKNYPEVVAKYSEYLKLTNYEDESRIFNCAFAAYNAKKYDDAIKFYDMAIQKGYKADDAYVGKAMSLRSQDKAADFTATVEAGLKANAQNANLEKLLYAYCMKKGQAAQKAGKTEGWHDAAFFNMCRPLELVFSNGMDKGEMVGIPTGDVTQMKTFDEFFDAYKKQMEYCISLLVNADNAIDVAHAERCPLPFLSCMIDDCLKEGKSVQEGGAVYNFTGPQGFGIANMADGLFAIRKLVYEDKKVSMKELKEALALN